MIKATPGRARTVSIPAPVGGWNAKDPLAEMPPTDAVTLDNWWPTSSDVRVRDGCVSHATALGAHVETLMTYSSTSTSKMFAVAGGNVYDASSAGSVGGSSPSAYPMNSDLAAIQAHFGAGYAQLALSGSNQTGTYTYTATATENAIIGEASPITLNAAAVEWSFSVDALTGVNTGSVACAAGLESTANSGNKVLASHIARANGKYDFAITIYTAGVPATVYDSLNTVSPVGNVLLCFDAGTLRAFVDDVEVTLSADTVATGNFTPYVEVLEAAGVDAANIGSTAAVTLRSLASSMATTVYPDGQKDPGGNSLAGAAIQTTFSNSRIYAENFTTAAGNFLFCCSGVDDPKHYNGSIWAVPSITGVTASTLVQPCAFKSRLFFVQADSMSAWYLPVNSIAGAATEIPLGGIFADGGYIMAMGTWTLDAGRGVDDHAVFVTNKGEVAIYAGSDPSSSATWSLVGVYRIGAPIGRRCMVKYGGDLLIICLDGVFPLSAALQSTRVDTAQAISDRIRTAVSEATGNYGSIFGWQVLPYPDKNAVLLNVPVSASRSNQYVMNAITGAWCRFTGWDAYYLCIFNNSLYFGGNGTVYRAWTGRNDDGDNILADAKPAFSDFGARAQKKHFQMVKPYFGTDGSVAPAMRLNIDYSDDLPTSTPSAIPSISAVWDASNWDESVWGGSLTPYAKWAKVNGIGYMGALRVRVATNTNEVRWYSTDYMVELGGIL